MQIRCGLLISLLAAVSVAGCEGGATNEARTSSVSIAAPDTATAASSPDAAVRAAEALRDSGAYDEAMNVLATAYRRFPGNGAIASAYGRLALLGGDEERAAPLLREAVAANPADWRALSALGVLDSRKGRQTDARMALSKANAMSGGEAVVLNNLAVNHLLAGQPAPAAALLRQALASPTLKAAHARRVKRNLALALAMEGEFADAEALAGESFPHDLDYTNPAVIRRFLGMGDALPALQNEQARLARSWRPVDDPSAP